jgi:hypothetical protein
MNVNGFTLDFCEGVWGDVVRKPIPSTPSGIAPANVEMGGAALLALSR